MVGIGSSFVNGSSESLEPVVQFAGERDRDPREPPAAPVGDTTTEQLGLDSGVVVVQIFAAHHDAYVGRQ